VRKQILLIVFFVAFCLGGCATIMHGDSQYIEANSVPSGATVYIEGKYFTTPAKILLKRGYPAQEYQALFQKEGLKPAYAKIGQKLSGWLWGDILWGIIPGIAVDMGTGGAFDLTPKQINVTLEQSAK
jgi:hypothetical protein